MSAVPPALGSHAAIAGERFVFVGGLHRSGTSPIARWLGAHPGVSAFVETGVAEDEGQHLQSVYPVAGALGGAGGFAFDSESHRTEASPLVSEASRRSLLESWGPHWDLAKPLLLEKSPPNLLSARFLRALFPGCRNIMVVRHPIAVSLATRRWKPAPDDLELLVRHWIVAHEILLEDAKHTDDDLVVVRYEDLMAAPDVELARLFAFLDLAPYEGRYQVRAGLNDKYFAQWRPWWRPVRRRTVGRIVAELEARVAPFGYSLSDPARLAEPGTAVRALSPLSVKAAAKSK